MTGSLLSLKWNHHHSTLLEVVAHLRLKGTFCDVTVVCNGKFYSLHKIVLSTCSEYFSEIFNTVETKNPVIVLKDVNTDDFEYVLDYMYVGQVNVEQEKLASLIQLAECLRVKGLAVPDETPPTTKPPNLKSTDVNEWERKDSQPPTKRKKVTEDDTKDESPPSPRDEHSSPIKLSCDDSINSNRSVSEDAPKVYKEEMPSCSSGYVETTENSTDDRYSSHSMQHHSDAPILTQNDCKEEIGFIETSQMVDIKPNVHNTSNNSFPTIDNATTDQQPNTVTESSNPLQGILSHCYPSTSGLQQDSVNSFSALPQNSQMVPPKDDIPGILPNSSDLLPPAMSLLICNFCLRGFDDQATLAKHEQYHLTNAASGNIPSNKNLLCPYCDYQTSVKESLRCHVRTHTGERPYHCPHCTFSSATRATMNRHVHCHSNIKPFACPYCVYRSARKDNLNLHVRKVHLQKMQT